MNNVQRAGSRHPQFRFPRRVRCRGQTLVEYALILSIISIVLVGVIVNLGQQVTKIFSTVNSQIASAPTAASSSH